MSDESNSPARGTARSPRTAGRRTSRAGGRAPAFDPVATRARADGWTPDRQLRFIDALAAGGCVTQACVAVGMGRSAAYELRARPEARQFRLAWDAALDVGVRALTDACFSRALEGEAVPIFYKGEQVGERRRYDNRLAMFLMRYRDPLRYAATLDQMIYDGHPEQAAVALTRARNRLLDEAHGAPVLGEDGPATPYGTEPVASVAAREAEAALIAGDAPIGGSCERRQRLTRLREQRVRRELGQE